MGSTIDWYVYREQKKIIKSKKMVNVDAVITAILICIICFYTQDQYIKYFYGRYFLWIYICLKYKIALSS